MVPLWVYIASLVIVVFIGYGAGFGAGAVQNRASNPPVSAASSPDTQQQPTQAPAQPTPTPRPTQPPKWTTVQSFSGNGGKHTATFTVPDDWRISWTCNPTSFNGLDYNVIIEVDNASDGSVLDLPVNTMCKAGHTSDTSEEHQAGTVYLNVTSEGDWSIAVQVLK
jgi:hypothetical protein